VVVQTLPTQIDQLRAVTREEIARVRDEANARLDRISWTLPSEIQRVMGASAGDLDAIRTDVAKIQRTLSEAIGEIPSA
jgi:hypothetical protein